MRKLIKADGVVEELAAARLRELLHYDALTGVFTCLVARGSLPAGAVAGSTDAEGYRVLSIDGKDYKAHNLAWLYMTGEWPTTEIDHEDGNRGRNVWTNLREGSHQFNMQNRRRANRGNRTGLLGVDEYREGFFRAKIRVDGRQKHLGVFATPEAAHDAYLAAKRVHHASCTI